MTEPRYPYVHVDVPADDSDEASATLFDLGAQGVEERDASTLIKGAHSAEGCVTLVASFESHQAAHEAIAALDPAWNPRLDEVVGDAWRDEWKKHFHPFSICEGIVIRPPWEPYEAKASERVLEFEPGRAFGTGLHETTSLVAAALAARKSELEGARILDVGCGSGILSVLAIALGAKEAVAIDIDEDAVHVTRENAERNGVTDRIVSYVGEASNVAERFPVVVANIETRVLVPHAAALIACVAQGGVLVLSGILEAQVDDVKEAYKSLALDEVAARGEWVAVVYRNGAPRAA